MITEWLLTQIEADEKAARAAIDETAVFRRDPAEWRSVDWMWSIVTEHQSGGGGSSFVRSAEPPSPERVLADCEAKRRIVELCRPSYAVIYRESDRLLADAFDREAVQTVAHSGPIWPFDAAESILRTLALPYADRAGYDEGWRP